MKTKTTTKILKIFAICILFLGVTDIVAQTSTSPTQDVCIGSSEPYLLNPSNSTSTYQWVLSSGGVITTGQGSGSILIDWDIVPGGPHTLTVTETDANGCLGPPKTVDVTLYDLDDASFVLTDYCEGTSNAASGIVTAGGTFMFNPVPTGGETIDPITGEITGGLSGVSYTVEYTTAGICPDSQIQNVLIYSTPSTGPIFHN